jgi:hypothetical protein
MTVRAVPAMPKNKPQTAALNSSAIPLSAASSSLKIPLPAGSEKLTN